jgi:hypothetical protein
MVHVRQNSALVRSGSGSRYDPATETHAVSHLGS